MERDKKIQIGDVISFGHHYSELVNLKKTINPFSKIKEKREIQRKPMEWIVKDIQDGKALLISKYGFEVKDFVKRWSYQRWKDNRVREWLNNAFLKEAFTEEERMLIVPKTISEEKTEDSVFLLSISEAEEYFESDRERKCMLTPGSANRPKYGCWWWLRSPGNLNRYAACVAGNGEIGIEGADLLLSPVCIRPAMWVSLN